MICLPTGKRQLWSPSARRAWVEIVCARLQALMSPRRPPQGGRGLKYIILVMVMSHASSPSARRAWVEITSRRSRARPTTSPSARRAWVEISGREPDVNGIAQSPSARRAWVEISTAAEKRRINSRSPSARRAWVEMGQRRRRGWAGRRRPPQGGRGLKYAWFCHYFVPPLVALRKEGVG